jgi:AraC-like DNA-binding protein
MPNDYRYAAARGAVPRTPPSLLRPARRAPGATPRRSNGSESAVVTMLTPAERPGVDAAGEGCYVTLHRDNVDEVLQDLRSCRAQAVLVSVSCCTERSASSMARLVREFPAVPAVALLSESHAGSAQAVLTLGQYGVQSLVDVRDPTGWRTLRQLFASQRGDSIERRASARLTIALHEAPEDCRRFLDACFQSPARVGTVRQLAKRLGVQASTLMSRFYRANLPAPKRYLACARLVRAAALFENPGLSITQVANTLDYSSPQSFGRHVHTMLGLTAVAFRREYDGARMLDRFFEELIDPHAHVLRMFRPLVVIPPWSRVVESPDLSATRPPTLLVPRQATH